MAGVATLTASAVATAPSVQPLPSPAPAIQLAGAVQPQDEPGPHVLQILLTDPARLLGPARPIGTITPPPAPIEFSSAPNLADTIDNVYIAIEPWVEYGFQVATDIVGWIPWVGGLAGQIMVFYRFGEGMVASGAFNIADWLRGDGGVVENLVDFGIDVGLAFIWLGIDEYNYFLPPLPPGLPRPPRPPHEGRPGPSLLTFLGLAEAPGLGVENAGSGLLGLIDRVLNPVNADGDVDGALNGGAALTSLIRNGISEIGDLLGIPLLPSASVPAGELEKTSEISTVPPMVKTPFGRLNSALDSVRNRVGTEADVDETTAGPLTEVTKSVRNVRKEIRANFNAATERRTDAAASNGVVRAQGEVRGAVVKAANDVVNSLRGDKSDGAAEDVAKAPSTVAKSLGDTAMKVVKEVRQAAKEVREAAKDRVGADDK